MTVRPAPPKAIAALPRLLAMLAVLFLALVSLAGCFAAKSYNAQMKIAPDGAYRFFAEGVALHAPSAFALRKLERDMRVVDPKEKAKKEEEAKARKAEIEGALAKQIADCLKDPRVQTMQAIGEGRVRFAVSMPGTLAGTDLIRREWLSPVSLARHPDGSVTFRIKDVAPTPDARALKVVPDGDISITVAEGVQVLAHNAAKAPGTPTGAYRWHIGSPDDPVPFMTILLPGAQPIAFAPPAPEKQPEPKPAAPKKKARR